MNVEIGEGLLLRHYGVPEWLVILVKDLHENTICKVMVDGSLSDAFEVKSGVIQRPLCCLLWL